MRFDLILFSSARFFSQTALIRSSNHPARLCRLLPTGRKNLPSQGKALTSSINPNPFFIRRDFNPPPAPSLSREGSNRSSCRSDTKVSWDHQRSRLVFLSAGAQKYLTIFLQVSNIISIFAASKVRFWLSGQNPERARLYRHYPF